MTKTNFPDDARTQQAGLGPANKRRSDKIARDGLAAYRDRSAAFRAGAFDALKLPAPMVGASMLGYGPLARDQGWDIWQAMASSVLIWGLPGQIALVELLAIGAPLIAALLASSMANARFMPMTASAMPLFARREDDPQGYGLPSRLIYAHLISVNTWVALHARGPSLPMDQRGPYYLSFSLTCMLGGVIGTGSGHLLAAGVPLWIGASLIFLNPTYFAFVFSGARERRLQVSLIIGACFGPPMHWVTPDWGVLLAGIAAGTLGFAIDRIWSKAAQKAEGQHG